MPRYFLDQESNYYETITEVEAPDGHSVVPQRPGPFHEWDGNQWVNNPPSPPTSADLDARASEFADRVMQRNKDATRAMGEVLAKVIWRISNNDVPAGISEQQARTWVRNRFLEEYRALLD